MQLKEIMSRNVKLGSPDMTIQEAARLMRDGDFGALPVAEDSRLVGIVTDRDITVRCCADGRVPTETSLGEIMSEKIYSADEDADVDEAAAIMQQRQVRRLPVVDKDKKVIGIVALGDFAVESSEIRPAAKTLSAVSESGA